MYNRTTMEPIGSNSLTPLFLLPTDVAAKARVEKRGPVVIEIEPFHIPELSQGSMVLLMPTDSKGVKHSFDISYIHGL